MRLLQRPIHAGFAPLVAVVISVTVSTAGCGRHQARARIPVAPARIGTIETGVASWYGIPYHGRRAASGEVFDMNAATAAHRKLPFQTWVEVTNLSNGRSTDVRITDRGPFVRGRIIDLSQAAARDIDILRSGTARVRLRVINPPKEVAREPKNVPAVSAAARISPAPQDPGAAAPVDWYAVQAGAFADANRAESLRVNLENIFMDARVIPGEKGLWRVLVGRELTLDQANELSLRVRTEAGAAIVVREPEPPVLDIPTPK